MVAPPLEPGPVSPSDEIALVNRAQARESEAFSELCRRHGPALLRQAHALSGDSAAAEDLVQETFVQAWNSLHRFNGECRFFTWLCAILLNRHRGHRRKRWPIPFSFLWRSEDRQAEPALLDQPDPASLPDEALRQSERAVQVLRSLQRLPQKQREVLHLRFYAGESLEGIAAVLGVSSGTVKSRLFHGLERLGKMKVIEDNRHV